MKTVIKQNYRQKLIYKNDNENITKKFTYRLFENKIKLLNTEREDQV